MKNDLKSAILLCLLMFSMIGANAADFTDFRVDLTNGNLLTAEEISPKTSFEFGIAVASDGTVSRVEKGSTNAVATLSGVFHSNEHGWNNFKATVAVDGPVKISMGTCAWGGDVTVKDASGNVVATMNTNTGSCYHNDKTENIESTYYKSDAPTTLTISGGSYTPYFSVRRASASELTPEVTISYSLGTVEAEGVVPSAERTEVGKAYTIPVNRTLYMPGKTLTGWTDGTNIYQPGEEITAPSSDATLTPVFTDNAVSLADRTEETTLLFDFQRRNGAPLLSYQHKNGIYVTQAMVAGKTIDVKLDFDTSNGKIANGGWSDWCQMNGGTILSVPSCKGATVSMEAFTDITTTTIDGQNDYTHATTISYVVANSAESINIVIGDGSYYRYVKVVLPVVKPAGKTYVNESAIVEWAFSGNATDNASINPEDAVSIASFAHGDGLDVASSGGYNGKVYTRFQPKSQESGIGEANRLEWKVTPAKGLVFTPTKVSANIRRFGTDGGRIDVYVVNAEGKRVTLAEGLIPARNKPADEDKTSLDPNYRESFALNVPDSLASSEGVSLVCYLYGLATNKQAGFNDVKIEGTVSGTIVNVPTYAFNAEADPAEAASITVYPLAEEYDEGTEVKVTATPKFGYRFVNWTDGEGNVVGTDNVVNYTVNAATTLTAHFQVVKAYTLSYDVAGGAADYMVNANPLPTVVDGKKMYEEGTLVTLSASSNDVLSFTNWSDGQTSSEITLTMDADKVITAEYSAVDFIAAWDFYQKGGEGRKADFFSEGNDADQLVLRDADGNTSGWLDKSQVAAGGYEGRPAAVNWRSNAAIGTYYWQTKVDASNFTDIKVRSGMLYNYNAYQVYNVEYSLDGETWTTVGSIHMPGAKAWTDATFDLPAEANNQPAVYIRWKADTSSDIDGSESNYDGSAISQIYILGTEKLVDDGKAPILVSTIPASGATNVSANGKVVLIFDEKVQVVEGTKATLGTMEVTPTVSGKTVSFEYKGLDYSTNYTFSLPGHSVNDLTGNGIAETITLSFTTRTKPVVAKGTYDFVVPDDGTFVEALTAANTRKDKTVRYRIFVKQGTYVLPVDSSKTTTGSDGKTYFSVTHVLSADNVSVIGEDMNSTIIINDVPYENIAGQYGPACPIEGIGHCDLLQISAKNTYLEDVTLKTGTADATGRNLAVQDRGDKTIYKNVKLHGYQDTWTSNGDKSRYYFEDGVIRGRTDYICGKGDAFFNGVTFQNVAGGYIAVPSRPRKWGWIMSNCTIIGETADVDGNYTLGRPWGSGTPVALWINTKMVAQPSAIGWNEMSGGWPARFAEYNSTTASGTVIDLSNRKTTFGDGHANNPVLSADEAAQYTISNVMGDDDDWDPTALTEQASAPENVKLEGNVLTWNDNNYVLCWAVCKDGHVVDFTTEPAFQLDNADGTWSVRAANEMGGLGEASEAKIITDGIADVNVGGETGHAIKAEVYTLDGTRIAAPARGVNIVVKTFADGSKKAEKVILK